MGIPGSPNALLMRRAAAAAADDGAYQIKHSVRFNRADEAFLRRIPVNSGNRKTWTWAGWVKRSSTANDYLWCVDDTYSVGAHLMTAGDKIQYFQYESGSYTTRLQTNAVFRDKSAWYHIVLVYDSPNSVSSDRIRLYINGIRETSFAYATYPSQDHEGKVNTGGLEHELARDASWNSTEQYLDGYMADIHFIDGKACDPATFGAFDNTGCWNPIDPYDSNGKLKLPAPNKGVTHSSTLTSSSGWNYGAVGDLFDGVATEATSVNPTSGHTATWKPATEITGQTFEIYCKVEDNTASDHLTVNGKNYFNEVYDQLGNNTWGWAKLDGLRSINTTQGLTFKRTDGNKQCAPSAIRVDGVILVDGQTDPATWDNTWSETFATAKSLLDCTASSCDDVSDSNHNTSDGGSPTYDATPGTNSFGITECIALDGSDDFIVPVNADLSINNSTDTTIDIHFYIDSSGSGEGYLYDFRTTGDGYCYYNHTADSIGIRGASGVTTSGISNPGKDTWHHLRITPTEVWLDGTALGIAPGKTAIGSVVSGRRHAAYSGNWNYFKGKIGSLRILNYDLGAPPAGGEVCVNGVLQKVPTKTHDQINSFNLNFSDISLNRYVGKDTFNGIISTATGGLSIYNTDTSGDVKESGYRTDSAKANLMLAIPGDTIADVSHVADLRNSGSAKTLTNQGNVSVSSGQSRLYGSSMRFNATGDSYLKGGGNSDYAFGTGQFTIEFWFYNLDTNADSTQRGIMQVSGATAGLSTSYTNGWFIGTGINASSTHDNAIRFRLGDSSNNQIGGNQATPNEWHHVAVTRDSSNVIRMFVDGEIIDSVTNAYDFSASYLAIGGYYNTSYILDGYLQDIRLYKTAKYTAKYKPPTRNDWAVNNLFNATGTITPSGAATGGLPILNVTTSAGTAYASPVAAATDGISNKQLYLPFQGANGGSTFTDYSGNSRTPDDVMGTPSTSTGSAKFGGVSGYFDGTTDWISYDQAAWQISANTTDWTVEFWFRWDNGSSGNRGICGVLGNGGNNQSWFVALDSNHKIKTEMYLGGTWRNITCDNAISADTWTHVSCCVHGGTYTMYINGTAQSTTVSGISGTTSLPVNAEPFYIGTLGHNNYSEFKGYIQDFRLVDDGLHTGNFTVPGTVPYFAPDYELDLLTDTPTNYVPTGGNESTGGVTRGNYCTLNPLETADNSGSNTINQGNLYAEGTSSSGAWHKIRSTMAIPKGDSGKWYYEVEQLAAATGNIDYNVGWDDPFFDSLFAGGMGDNAGSWCYKAQSGNKRSGGTNAGYGNAWNSVGDVLGVGYDNGSIYFWKNGTIQNSGTAAYTGVSATLCPTISIYTESNSVGKLSFNFGQRPFKHAQSGYHGYCAQNLPDLFGANSNAAEDLNEPAKYFNIHTWTGNATNRSFSKWAFQPDALWMKSRSGAQSHLMYDAIRGAGKILYPDLNNAEDSYTVSLQSFDSDGFTWGSDSYGNGNNGSFVFWGWDCGTAAATVSTSGSITPSAQWVNDTAGFSITKYEGTGANATVGHGLSKAPEFILVKNLEQVHHWNVYHVGIGNTNRLKMSQDYALGTPDAQYWNNTTPTSTVVHLGDHGIVNNSGYDLIMYAWRPVEGFSAFGMYDGNSSTDGVFQYTGFDVKWLMIKRTNSTSPWSIFDNARSRNENNHVLEADVNNQEATPTNRQVDLLSNGFKNRATSSNTNATGSTYIWMAFSDHPFKTARAR